jgi:hypothetical protein
VKVKVLSNLDEQCGNAAYARDLTRELKKHFTEVELGTHWEHDDVVLVNWCPSVVDFNSAVGIGWKSEGVKIVLIHQQSYGDSYLEKSLMDSVDAIVTHEPTNWGSVYIPHGIPEVDEIHGQSDKLTIGMAGFYFRAVKGFRVVKDVVQKLNAIGNFICGPHPSNKEFLKADTDELRNELPQGSRVLTEWLPVDSVVQLLGWSTVNIFWFNEQSEYERTGQSGSVGLGLASGRPILLSNSRKFRVLRELYSDEVYVANSPDELLDLVMVIENDYRPKVPNRILKDMGWSTVGKQYADLIKSL